MIINPRHILLCVLLLPLLLAAKIPDEKIDDCIQQYFRLNRLCPQLLDVDIFEHPTEGHTIRIRIIARRNQTRKDVGLAFSAAASVSNCASRKFDLFWVEMGVNYKETETTHFFAPAECTINALVQQNQSVADWWEQCVQIQ